MAIKGMDVERVDALVSQLDHQSMMIDAVVSVVDNAVAALAGIWFGENLNVFHGAWVGGQRAQAQSAAGDIAAALRTLRGEIAHQRTASSQDGGNVPGLAGSIPTPATATPKDMLAFAQDSETRSQAFLDSGRASDPGFQPPAGWHVASSAELEKLGIDPASLHDRSTGFDATIYSNRHGGYVVSFGGSVGNPLDPNNRDWGGAGGDWDQAASSLPGESDQVEQAANLAFALKSHVGAGNLVFTGHSLGGREAAVASVVTGARAVTFNPTGTTTDDLLYANALAGRSEGVAGMFGDLVSRGEVSHVSAEHGSSVTNYVITNDVARATHHDAASGYLGTVDFVASEKPDPRAAHSLSNFVGKI